MPVREFVKSDVPAVVSLYWNYMTERTGPPPPHLLTSFTELYFSNPFSRNPGPSFVYQDPSGEVLGFFGVTTRTMMFSGQPIRVGFAGNFVVHPRARSGVAAPGLLAAYISGDQDMLITDTANDISRHLMQRLRFQTIPALNLHWARPLRPSHYARFALGRGMTPATSFAFRLSTKPLCVVIDRLVGDLQRSRRPKIVLHPSELTVETLSHCLSQFRDGYSLRAEYDVRVLEWLLRFMDRSKKRGYLRKIVLRDDSNKVVGWYIYYSKPGAIGEVVQIGGAPDVFQSIMGHLLTDAREHDAIALHGRADPRKMADLSDQGCFFTCRGGWTLAFSHRPELIDILRRGEALLSRLDGEWCLDPGE